MIIDLKYHIASLVAVFLALGIGILVGSAVLGNNVNDVIMKQQKQMVDDLNRNFDKIRKDNVVAKEEITSYKTSLNVSKQFEQQLLPSLVVNKLAGKKIAIVETSNYGFNNDWINTLKLAGAKVHSITTVLDGIKLTDEKVRKEIATKLMLLDSSEAAVIKEVSKELAAGVMTAQNIENLHYFEQQGIIKISGEYGVPINAVIFVGGSQTNLVDRCAKLDIPMMEYFLSNKIQVYGVEASEVEYSYMKQYQKLKVSTIDNIDMIPGQVSLVMAVYGAQGNYGLKNTAKQLLPAIP
jgi:hypothetical protein